MPIDVENSGNYQLSFTISGSGQEVAVISLNRFLQIGENIVSFDINSSEVQKIDGPYGIVSGLALSNSASLQQSNLGQSAAYSIWQFEPDLAGDLDGDGDVDAADRNLLATFRNQNALVPGDRRDLNSDGTINILDLRAILRLR